MARVMRLALLGAVSLLAFSDRARHSRRQCAAVRPEQGRVRRLRLQGARYRTLRRLLLLERRSLRAARRAIGRAVVRAALTRARAFAQRPATADPLRQPTGIRANQRRRRIARRGRRRRHRIGQAPHRDPVRAHARRDRSGPRPRDRARISIRHGQGFWRADDVAVVGRGRHGPVPVARRRRP